MLPLAIGGIGALASGIGSFFGQESANSANRDIAREQMDFQREMATTQHQREVEDLRKAGLNPILSAGGSGASSPVGASATMQNSISPAITSALSAAQLAAQVDKINSDVDVNDANVSLLNAETAKSRADAKTAAANARLAEDKVPGADIEAKIDSGGVGKVTRNIDRFSNVLGPILGGMMKFAF